MNDEMDMNMNKDAEDDDNGLIGLKDESQPPLYELQPDVPIDEDGDVEEILKKLYRNAKDELFSGAPNNARLYGIDADQHTSPDLVTYFREKKKEKEEKGEKYTLQEDFKTLHTFALCAREAMDALRDKLKNKRHRQRNDQKQKATKKLKYARASWNSLRTILFPIPWQEKAAKEEAAKEKATKEKATKTNKDTTNLNVIGRFAEYLALKKVNDKALTRQTFAQKILEFIEHEKSNENLTSAILLFHERTTPYGFSDALRSSLMDLRQREGTKSLYDTTLNRMGAILTSQGVKYDDYEKNPSAYRPMLEGIITKHTIKAIEHVESFIKPPEKQTLSSPSPNALPSQKASPAPVEFQPNINMTPNLTVQEILDTDSSVTTIAKLLDQMELKNRKTYYYLCAKKKAGDCLLDRLLEKISPAPDIRVYSNDSQAFLRLKDRLLEDFPEEGVEKNRLNTALNYLQKNVFFTKELNKQLPGKKTSSRLQELDNSVWRFLEHLERQGVHYKSLEDNPVAFSKQIHDTSKKHHAWCSPSPYFFQHLRKHLSRHLLDDDMDALLKQHGQHIFSSHRTTVQTLIGEIAAFLIRESIPYERYLEKLESYEEEIKKVISSSRLFETLELIRGHLKDVANERSDAARQAREAGLAKGEPWAAIDTLLYALHAKASTTFFPASHETEPPIAQNTAQSTLRDLYGRFPQPAGKEPSLRALFDQLAEWREADDTSALPEGLRTEADILRLVEPMRLTEDEWADMAVELFRFAQRFGLKEKDFSALPPEREVPVLLAPATQEAALSTPDVSDNESSELSANSTPAQPLSPAMPIRRKRPAQNISASNDDADKPYDKLCDLYGLNPEATNFRWLPADGDPSALLLTPCNAQGKRIFHKGGLLQFSEAELRTLGLGDAPSSPRKRIRRDSPEPADPDIDMQDAAETAEPSRAASPPIKTEQIGDDQPFATRDAIPQSNLHTYLTIPTELPLYDIDDLSAPPEFLPHMEKIPMTERRQNYLPELDKLLAFRDRENPVWLNHGFRLSADKPQECHPNVKIRVAGFPPETQAEMFKLRQVAKQDQDTFLEKHKAALQAMWDGTKKNMAPPHAARFDVAQLSAWQTHSPEMAEQGQWGLVLKDYDHQPVGEFLFPFASVWLRSKEEIRDYIEKFGKEHFENYTFGLGDGSYLTSAGGGNLAQFINADYRKKGGGEMRALMVNLEVTDREGKPLTDCDGKPLKEISFPHIFQHKPFARGMEGTMPYGPVYWRDRQVSGEKAIREFFDQKKSDEFAAAGVLQAWERRHPGEPKANLLFDAVTACRMTEAAWEKEMRDRMQENDAMARRGIQPRRPPRQAYPPMKEAAPMWLIHRYETELAGQKVLVFLSFTDRHKGQVDNVRVLPRNATQAAEAALLEDMKSQTLDRIGERTVRLKGFPPKQAPQKVIKQDPESLMASRDASETDADRQAWEAIARLPAAERSARILARLNEEESAALRNKLPAAAKPREGEHLLIKTPQHGAKITTGPFFSDSQGVSYHYLPASFGEAIVAVPPHMRGGKAPFDVRYPYTINLPDSPQGQSPAAPPLRRSNRRR